jgi:2Fe-2S ferredoxin
MGGENPYIDQAPAKLPTKPYKVTFKVAGEVKEVTVDPENLPSRDGRKGALLSLALDAGLKIDHACGGVCACSTCHVIVSQGFDTCNEASEDEEDMLDLAPGLTANSRLACQCVPDGTSDVVVEVPDWNRNLVSEEHH